MRGPPPALARPRVAVIGDVHWTPAADHPLARVLEHVAGMEVDLVLLVGDLVGGPLHGTTLRRPGVRETYERRARACLEQVRALGAPVLWVPGNHDLPTLGVDDGLEGSVDGRVAEAAGLRVAGIGGAGPERFGFCYEWGEDEIRARRVPDCDVLLCHAPPRHTPLDRTDTGEHVGSDAIRERALAHRGALVCGHIHESAGVVLLGDCLCLNPGGLGAPFGAARVGYLGGTREAFCVDLERGAWTGIALEEAPPPRMG